MKIIVAHPGQQHSYKLASALKSKNMLSYYVTTVYDKDSFAMRIIKQICNNECLQKILKRKNHDLIDSEVIQYYEWRGLIEIIIGRIDKSRRIYYWWRARTANKFGIKVAKLAIRTKSDAVIMYDSNATSCFNYLKIKSPNILRVLDVSAANRLYMKMIYETDMEICPQFRDRLKQERISLWNESECIDLKNEIDDTQLFLCPSTFVMESLRYSGVSEDKMKLCRYGSNFKIIKREYRVNSSDCLKAVYVGNVTEMKGIYYLLEAALQISPNVIRLKIVGNYNNNDGAFDKYMSHIDFLGRVPHERVEKILLDSDFFVFPSLGEGMSLSVLEAMACGLPCILSKNSGYSDLITDGVNGFLVNIQSVEEIKNRMLWFAENKDRIAELGKRSNQIVSKFTWERYNEDVTSIILEYYNKKET